MMKVVFYELRSTCLLTFFSELERYRNFDGNVLLQKMSLRLFFLCGDELSFWMFSNALFFIELFGTFFAEM